MIDFTCPHGKRILKIPEEYLGQKGRCNHCGCGITVPEANRLPPAPPPDSNALLTPNRKDKLSRRARRVIVASLGSVAVLLLGGLVVIGQHELAERARIEREEKGREAARQEAATADREAKREAEREQAAKRKVEARRLADEIESIDKRIADSDEELKRLAAEFNERKRKILDATSQNAPPAAIAKMSVELMLKAPATAKFDEFPMIINLGNGQYKVHSYVDAQNDFGALLRSYYTAVVRDTGDKGVGLNGWVCDSLDMF